MSEKVRIGIIGAGKIVEAFHIAGFTKAAGSEIVAIADVNLRRAEYVAKRNGIPKVFSDYCHILEMDDVDAVSICTPNKSHAPIAVAAAQAGKHILCEKPIATTLEEARSMISSAEENGVILMVEFPKRFDPVSTLVKEILDEEIIGRIFSVRTKWAHAGPEYWSPAGEWFFVPESAGGGALLDLGIHNIDMIRWFIGDISEVVGIRRTLVKDIKVEDNACIGCTFENGALGVIEASWSSTPSFMGTEIYGTEGRILVDYPNTPLEVHLNRKVPGTFMPKVPNNTGNNDGHIRCIEYFVDCVLNNRKPMTATGYDAMKALEVVLAAYESSRTGKAIHLPLKEIVQ